MALRSHYTWKVHVQLSEGEKWEWRLEEVCWHRCVPALHFQEPPAPADENKAIRVPSGASGAATGVAAAAGESGGRMKHGVLWSTLIDNSSGCTNAGTRALFRANCSTTGGTSRSLFSTLF